MVTGIGRPLLSVVVLTHNRISLLRRTLRSVLAQDFSALELIVVDNGSEDDTAEMVRQEFPSAQLIELFENTGIRGRNIGFRAARAPLILSLDDDIAATRVCLLAEQSAGPGNVTLRM